MKFIYEGYIKDFDNDTQEISIEHNLDCWFYEFYYIYVYLIKNKKDIDVISYYSEEYQNFLFKRGDMVSNGDFFNNFIFFTPERNKLIIKIPYGNYNEFIFTKENSKIIKNNYKKIKIIIGRIKCQ